MNPEYSACRLGIVLEGSVTRRFLQCVRCFCRKPNRDVLLTRMQDTNLFPPALNSLIDLHHQFSVGFINDVRLEQRVDLDRGPCRRKA